MRTALDPFSFLVTCIAGWMNQHQHHIVNYLIEENRVLRVLFKNAIGEIHIAPLAEKAICSHDIFIDPRQGPSESANYAFSLEKSVVLDPFLRNKHSTDTLAVFMLLLGSNNSAVRPIVGGISPRPLSHELLLLE